MESGCESIRTFLLHEFVDRLAEIVDRLLIAFLCGFDNAVLQMILKNDLAGIVDRGAHRGDLNQHLGAVASFLYHALDRLQMPDCARKAIDDRFGVFVGVRVPVRMRMWNAQRVHGFVIHFMRVFHIVNMLVAHLRFTSDCLNSIVNA